jgi:hypothetical protein
MRTMSKRLGHASLFVILSSVSHVSRTMHICYATQNLIPPCTKPILAAKREVDDPESQNLEVVETISLRKMCMTIIS